MDFFSTLLGLFRKADRRANGASRIVALFARVHESVAGTFETSGPALTSVGDVRFRGQSGPRGCARSQRMTPKRTYTSLHGLDILLGNEEVGGKMTNVSSDTPRSFWRKLVRTSIKVDAVANAAGVIVGLRDEEQVFELPARLFEQLPFAVYVCDRDGLVLRYNRRAAELWGRSPKLGDPNERFCGSYRMFRPDGSLLPHHQCPMADVLRTGISVRQQEVHIERPDGLRGIALVDIEAVKDSDGNVVGAVNCFQDITERKRSEAQIVNLAHEAEHRTKNILSTVLATVRLSIPIRLMISSN